MGQPWINKVFFFFFFFFFCTIVEIKHEALLFFSEVAFIWLPFLFVPSSPAEFLRRCKGLNNGCWGD